MLVVKMANWNHFYISLLHSECTPLRTTSKVLAFLSLTRLLRMKLTTMMDSTQFPTS